MNAQRADVIIVGGGIMGASAAFFLRKRGVSVILLERGLIGQQASGVNFGNVRRQGRYIDQLPLASRPAASTLATCAGRAATSTSCRWQTARARSGSSSRS